MRLTAARVKASVAVHRLVFPVLGPMTVGGKVGAPLYSTERIDVNGSHSGAAGLSDLTAHVARDLLEIVVGVGNDPTGFLLERKELSHHVFELPRLASLEKPVGVAVLGVGVAAEVDNAAQLARASNNRQQLVEVVALDHCVESDSGDSNLTHAWNRAHDLR